MKLIKIKPVYLFLTVVAGLTLLYGCPRESTSAPSDDGLDESYVSHQEVTIKHKKGTSPCPQNAEEEVYAYCKIDAGLSGQSGCEFDSVKVSCDHFAILCSMVDGHSTASFDSIGEQRIYIAFNCALPESFSTQVHCDFYSKGAAEYKEDINLTVEVE